MIIGIKDVSKLAGISIIACCAVWVCTLFTNFYYDVLLIEDQVTTELSRIFFDAQTMTAKVVVLVSGGCLLATSIVMLLFFIKHYIDTHKQELGILKALGHSNFAIAKSFWFFGISVLLGTSLGFGGAFLQMPRFYALQNEDGFLPQFTLHFHLPVFLFYVILPTLAFGLLAILYAWWRLKMPVLALLKDCLTDAPAKEKRRSDTASAGPFLEDLKKNTLRSRKVLVFFIMFASFCFSAMTQMSTSMKDLSSEAMGLMMLIIGLVLAFVTMYLAITTVVNGSRKTIAMMRIFGYSQKECASALLGGYRPLSYIGFAIGTVYQYGLLRLMVDVVFKDFEGIPEYNFDLPVMLICLALFMVTYESMMYFYSRKIKKISIKEIMLEG